MNRQLKSDFTFAMDPSDFEHLSDASLILIGGRYQLDDDDIIIDDQGNPTDEVMIRLPVERRVCRRCNGTGKHVDPNIDGNGITPDEMDEAGPEFMEDYVNGVYDVPCHRCNGRNVEDIPDLKRWPKDLSKLWRDQERDIAESIAIQRAEIAMGA